MQEIISIDEYTRRQKEVFNTYVEANGRETALLPLIEKYSKDDNTEYKRDDIMRYITSYRKSNLITEEEKEAFRQTKVVSNEVIFKRGKAVIKALIESQGDITLLSKYAKAFAKKDGKLKPYTVKYVEKCRDYYLAHSSNQTLISSYNTINELSKRGQYDVELLNQILQIEKNVDAVKFIKEINISKASLKNLIEGYKVLYPANKDDYNRLLRIHKDAYKANDDVMKFVDLRISHDTLNERINKLKRLLEDYLITDTKDITELFSKYQLTEYKFKETMKDAKSSRDIILNSLLSKYLLKESVIENEVKTILDKILYIIEHGINYGNEYREINLYDFYRIKDDYKKEELLSFAKRMFNKDDYNKLQGVINSFNEGITYDSIDELLISIEDQDISYEEMEDVAYYMKEKNMPLTKELLLATYERYHGNDIQIEKSEENLLVA